jgi:hypothetical protein
MDRGGGAAVSAGHRAGRGAYSLRKFVMMYCKMFFNQASRQNLQEIPS